MAVVIHGILDESRQYYRKIKTETVGRLLINPRGHMKRNIVSGKAYAILRRTRSGMCKDSYIGPWESEQAAHYSLWISQSKKDIATLRDVKQAMKVLNMSKEEICSEEYPSILADIVTVFDAEKLWECGLELIGSWCFKVYQSNCGVEYYPERTLDVYFAVALPYTGPRKDIGELLQKLGFSQKFHHDGTIKYVSAELEVKFLKDRRGDGSPSKQRGSQETEKDLGIAPVAVPYLRILLDNRMTLQARDIGKVVVPSMPAFMLHKILVAGKRRKHDKRVKDLRQAEAVAKTILLDPGLLQEVARIAGGLHKKWLEAIRKEAGNMSALLPDNSGAVSAVMQSLAGA
jgi:hypothetical protein